MPWDTLCPQNAGHRQRVRTDFVGAIHRRGWIMHEPRKGFSQQQNGAFMRIEQLSPLVTPWKNGQTLSASSWHSVDYRDPRDGACLRRVWHYETLMVEFVTYGGPEWFANPMSVGLGSVSDQNGVNTLFAATSSPLRFRRDAKGGGPRVVNSTGGNLVAVADGSDRQAWAVWQEVNA